MKTSNRGVILPTQIVISLICKKTVKKVVNSVMVRRCFVTFIYKISDFIFRSLISPLTSLMCYLNIVDVDCKWDSWQAWTTCSTTCGRGKSTRTRAVRIPAFRGGRSCIGKNEELKCCFNMEARICPGKQTVL